MVYVNRKAVIIEGVFKGISGKVVAVENDDVTIQVDPQSFIHLSSKYIDQKSTC